MDDLISRQQVLSYIDRIMTQGTGKNKSFDFMRKYVENMPSAQPETCDTCKHGYFGDTHCDYCCMRYPSHYERRTDG